VNLQREVEGVSVYDIGGIILRSASFRANFIQINKITIGIGMRKFEGQILFSASDLMRFMGCAHATTLDVEHMHGTGPKPRASTEDAALLQKQGDAHESAHLAKLKEMGRSVVEIDHGSLNTLCALPVFTQNERGNA
jgi:hypothetical protein